MIRPSRSSIPRRYPGVAMPKRLALVLLLLAAASPAIASKPEGELSWLNAYAGRHYTLRASVNANRFVFLPVVHDLATLELKGELFPLMGPEAIVVRDVDLDLDRAMATFTFTSEHGDKGELVFAAPLNSSETMGQAQVDGLLALVTEEGGVAPFLVNAEANVLHFKGSNHAGGFAVGAEYQDVASAQADGVKLCTACFAPIHLLPDYEKEVALGRRVAVEVRNAYPAVTDDAVQRRVREVGHRVLEHWPLPLRGYQYRFTVVESADPNASACPGGWIFVHDGLLDLCESDVELEAVLAHEISHVEMRHGLRQLRSAEKAANAGVFASIVVAAAAASQGAEGAGVAVAAGMAAVIATTATELALAGYSRDMEMESDAAAVHYLVRTAGEADRRHLARILAKLEYHEGCRGDAWSGDPRVSDHPPNTVRSDFAANAETMFFDEPMTFAFTTDDGGHYELDIVGICHHAYFEPQGQLVYEDQQAYEFGLDEGHYDYSQYGTNRSDTRIFASVRAGAGVQRGMEFKDMDLQMDGAWLKFDNKEDTTLYPNAEVSMVLVRRQKGLVSFNSLVPAQVRHSGQAQEAGKGGKVKKGASDPLR